PAHRGDGGIRWTPERRGVWHRVRRGRRIGGLERVVTEGIQHIREEQLLMLLLVREPELHQRDERRVLLPVFQSLEQRRHPLVDLPSPAGDLLRGGAREQAALGT